MKWTMRLLVLCLSAIPAWSAMTYESTGACTAAEVPDSLKAALETTGHQAKDGGEVVAEVWFAKDLKVTKDPERRPDSDFPQLEPGVFMGVIRYGKTMSDFRTQTIKPGYYTMRYQLQPDDGAHLGTAPRRDFVLLLPVSLDTDPNEVQEFKKTNDLSMKASGTPHAQVVHLAWPPSSTKYPSVIHMDGEMEVLAAKPNDIELGIVLVGKGGE
jgi:hypothetical protein